MLAFCGLLAHRYERGQPRGAPGPSVVPNLDIMKPNHDKIDDAVLALLHLTSFREGSKMFREYGGALQ